jgi:hypothetical protein
MDKLGLNPHTVYLKVAQKGSAGLLIKARHSFAPGLGRAFNEMHARVIPGKDTDGRILETLHALNDGIPITPPPLLAWNRLRMYDQEKRKLVSYMGWEEIPYTKSGLSKK